MYSVLRACVEAFDALQVLAEVIASGRVHPHHRVDALVHELLHQRGVEVAGIERDEMHGRAFRSGLRQA
jgi:hypothetical protein